MVLESCVLFWSMFHQLDPALTHAVIKTESNYNQMALGPAKDSGLMQIRPKFVPESQLQLLNSCTNIMRGTSILAGLKAKNPLDLYFVNCYNLGSLGCRKLKHPKKWNYYVKISANIRRQQ